MNRYLRAAAIFLFPYLMMVVVNECVRPFIKEKPYSAFGITAMNPGKAVKDKCTWMCHNSTGYCQQHHVKMDKQYFAITDHYYYGLIDLLAYTGFYGAANIVLLVVSIPLMLWFWLVKIWNMQDDINRIKKAL